MKHSSPCQLILAGAFFVDGDMVSLPTQMESETDGDYELFRDIALFDEHIGDDGVVYDEELLKHIRDNGNFRIDDTGDWCPLIAGHTPDEPGQEQPEILGWAGPYRMGIVGNEKPRWCIFTDFRIHKDHAETYRRNPRRSVELWPEEDPKDRFFDPIAILGAETPKRPLGLTRYKASAASRKRIRYEMGADVTPVEGGGSNTYIPGGLGKKKKNPQTFNHEGTNMNMPLTPEFMAQLMEAQAPMLQAMIDDAVSNLLENDALAQAEAEPVEQGMEGVTGADPMPDMATPPAPAPPMEGEAPPGIPPMEPEGGIPPMEESPAAPSDAPPPEDMPTGAPEEVAEDKDKERSPFQKYAHDRIMKFMCADEGEHKADAMEYAMKFAQRLDETERAEMSDVYGMGESDDQKSFYAKFRYAMGDGEDPMKTEHPPGKSEGKEHDYGEEPKMEYAKKYAKVLAEKQALVNRNAELEAKNAKADRAIRHGKRVAALNLLAEDYAMPEDEIKHVENMTDTQFHAHIARIPVTYQKIKGPNLAGAAHAPESTSTDTAADAHSATAKAAVEKYSKIGKRRIPFKEAWDNVEANGGKYVVPA